MQKQQVMIQQKQPGLLENSMGMIGNAAGTAIGSIYGGTEGAKYGGMIGGALGGELGKPTNSPTAVSGEGRADSVARRMQKMDGGNDIRNAYEALGRIDDPELKAAAEPILSQAMNQQNEQMRRKRGQEYG